MSHDNRIIAYKNVFYKILIAMICLSFIGQECDDDMTKKQVWCEYDAMGGMNILNFDDMKYELKDIDTTRRLNKIDDELNITTQEWLNDSNDEGVDEVSSYLNSNRTIIDDFNTVY